ncbi:MAG: hypothetical protein AAB506_00805 [Patescibacteria group bacterium]
MPFYTKTGDGGETGLFDGRRVRKDHKIIEALGAIDELNAWIGLLKIQNPKSKIQNEGRETEAKNVPMFLETKQIKRDLCPSCGAGALVLEEGCAKCYACGFSKC